MICSYISSAVAVSLAAAFALAGCSGDSGIDPKPVENDEPGWHEGTLGHDGLDRVFRYYVPAGAAGDRPVVLLLHGGTRDMDVLFGPRGGGTQEWVEIADEEGAFLLVPNGTNAETGSPTGDDQAWNDCRPTGSGSGLTTADDVGFITSLLDWMGDHFDGQDARPNLRGVLTTGASNGGLMSYRLATEVPDRFAAAAVFIANLPDPSECAPAITPLPMMIVNGTLDQLMPWEGGEVAGGRGTVLSAEATRDVWIAVNGAATPPADTETLPDIDADDNSTITCEDYAAASASGAPVRFCTVDGGGHLMPSIDHQLFGRQNHDAEGARMAWEFFDR